MFFKRKYYSGRNLGKALSIEELRRMAQRRLPGFAFEFVESGAEDEVSLEANRAAFVNERFVPRTLVDTGKRTTAATFLGRERPSPLIIAPTGHNGMLWRQGDVCLARAAARLGIPFTLSTMSNIRLEKLPAAAGGELWMQLYVFAQPELTDDIVSRSRDSGYEVLVLTTDANVFGWREWDRRRYKAPGKLTLGGMLDVVLHPGWTRRIMWPHGLPRFENVIDFFPPEARDTRSTVTRLPDLFLPNIDWDSVARLRDQWSGKLLIKGILSVEDALRAAAAGCDGVILSNHGARHLDSCISPLDILPEVASSIGDRAAVIVDSGIRRGSDVVKAMALGADAVMVGRAPLYGLAAGGEEGVVKAMQMLQSEIHRVLGQIGVNRLDELDQSYLKGRHLPAGDAR